MIYDFGDMKEKYKYIYEKMWEDFDFSILKTEIIRTNSSEEQEGSKESYCFVGGENKKQILVDVFDLKKNEELFYEKYKMAVSGEGKEEGNITTLHSSALCALLHFYNVTKDNKLILKFIQNEKEREIEFTESFFEYKNPVYNKPSNMDVVLLGKEGNKDIILFLESKFSECYVSAEKEYDDISNKYLGEKEYSAPLYRDDFLKTMGLKKEKVDSGHFKLKAINDEFYIEGIKQTISHYVGVMKALNGKKYGGPKPDKHKDIEAKILEGNTKVMFGEIIFDDRIGDYKYKPNYEKGCGEIYKEKYNILAKKIGKLQEDYDRFEIIENVLSYSLFKEFKDRLDPNVRKFYRYE